jgi:hypothetical protein
MANVTCHMRSLCVSVCYMIRDMQAEPATQHRCTLARKHQQTNCTQMTQTHFTKMHTSRCKTNPAAHTNNAA